MSHQRILALGDNHGDTGSLEKVVDQTQGEEFDFIIHTGDITNAFKTDLQTGVEQLRAIEPYFEKLAERGTLVYIYGNRDKERTFGGEAQHITDEYELDVGHRLPAGESIIVDGQRFTANPDDADSDTILLTHWLSQHEFYQSPARAYFSGDTHRARHWGTALNTGYLHNDKGFNGAYFIGELGDDRMDVTVHGIDQSWKGFVCPDHEWYGRQFTPEQFGCGLCKFGTTRQFIPITSSVFTEIVGDVENETASIDNLVSGARKHIVDHNGFADQFREYLQALAEAEHAGPLDPLRPADEPNQLQQ
jgi:predicted phosphodiesterase